MVVITSRSFLSGIMLVGKEIQIQKSTRLHPNRKLVRNCLVIGRWCATSVLITIGVKCCSTSGTSVISSASGGNCWLFILVGSVRDSVSASGSADSGAGLVRWAEVGTIMSSCETTSAESTELSIFGVCVMGGFCASLALVPFATASAASGVVVLW